MTDRIGPAAAAAREAARYATGEFGVQHHSPPAVDDYADALERFCYECRERPAGADDGLCEACRHALTDRHGGCPVEVGRHTPWGPADRVEPVAPGIAIVDTDGHGGVKLSASRQRQMPEAFRRPGGWYEEDCEVLLCHFAFPDAFATVYRGRRDAEGLREDADERIRHWFPDAWERVHGRKLTAAESRAVAEREFFAAHRDRFLAEGASRADGEYGGAPDFAQEAAGGTLVIGHRAADGAVRRFLVPAGEYRGGTGVGTFVLDERAHPEWSVADRPAEKPPERSGCLARGLGSPVRVESALAPDQVTERQAGTARQELEKRWRARDGRIVTTRDLIDGDGGMVGKTVMSDTSGRAGYYVTHPDGSMRQVSHALWSALDVPDLRGRAERASLAVDRAEAAVERARVERDSDRLRRAQDRLERARADYGSAWAQDAAEARERERAHRERLDAAGAVPSSRAEFAVEFEKARAAVAEAGGFARAAGPVADRFEQLYLLGDRNQLFRG